MDREELAFNAWILIGNVLQTLPRGAADNAELYNLNLKLQPVQPPQMLETLSSLTSAQRAQLHAAAAEALANAGADSESTLGLSKVDAQPVLSFLADQA
jgi:hypothetical protein